MNSASYSAAPGLLLLGVLQCSCTEPTTTQQADPPDASIDVSIFDRAKLHTVEITVEARYLDQLAKDLDNRVPCSVRYDGEIVANVGIRQKGNTAVALADKPSFSIRFDEFDDKTDLHGEHKLLLNSSDQDPTFLREQIGADMYARAGLPTARIAHAVVKFNGADSGIYVVVEAIDKDFIQLQFGKDNDEGNLYEGPCCGDFVDNLSNMELQSGNEDDKGRDLSALAEVIQGAPDDQFTTSVSARLNLDAFITSYAIDALLDHWDDYAYRGNNYYVYDNPKDGRFVFIPHGMDRILKDTSFDTEVAPAMKLPLRIRAIPALDQKFHAELARVVQVVWDESAELASIDQGVQVIRTASAGDRTSQDLAKFNDKWSALRDDLTLRRKLVDPSIVCGDGKIEGLETCDDGNAVAGDGCSARCRIEP